MKNKYAYGTNMNENMNIMLAKLLHNIYYILNHLHVFFFLVCVDLQ